MLTTIGLALVLMAGAAGADSSFTRDEAGRTSASPLERDEILWLARCIYSESDRADEQRLVAWVVRNRVETRFRGDSYREVVLEARQFSAFNDPTPRRARILALTEADTNPAWQRALDIAREVYHARTTERPFPATTRHFYSPVSMKGRAEPHWAVAETPLPLASMNIDPYRFRFFDGIDDGVGAEEEIAEDLIRARHDAVTGSMRKSRRSMRLSGRVPRPVPPQLPQRSPR